MKINVILKIFIALGSIFLLSKYNFLDFSVFFTLNASLILKLFVLIVAVIILGTFKWYFLLKIQNGSISFRKVFEAYYLGYALNYILFGVAGDVVKTIYIIKDKDNKIGISLSVVIDRLIGLFSMLIIIAFFLPNIFTLNNISVQNNYINSVNLNLYYIFLFIFLISLILFSRKCLNSRRVNKKILLYLYKYKNKKIKLIAKTFKVLFSYRKATKNLLINLIIAIILQFIIGYALYLISLYIISQDTTFFNNLIASLAVQIISVIPLSPGNIGVGEAAFSQIMYLLNSNILLHYASVYFIFRIFNMIFSVPGVIIYYMFMRRS